MTRPLAVTTSRICAELDAARATEGNARRRDKAQAEYLERKEGYHDLRQVPESGHSEVTGRQPLRGGPLPATWQPSSPKLCASL
jgi:hypothetical protein